MHRRVALLLPRVKAARPALGIGCGDGRFPSIHTRVADFLPWIRDVSGLQLAP